jgi:hypothetical protein
MQNVHTVGIITGSNNSADDQLLVGVQSGVANGAGGAGAVVATVVTFSKELPAKYAVVVTPSQDAMHYITARTSTGFTVNLAPHLSASSLAAGTFDVVVLG